MLTLSLVSCGDRSRGVATAPAALPAGIVPTHGYVRGDADGDADTRVPDADDALIRDYGHPAGVAQRRAAIALLRRYYESAAGADVTTACALTDRALADSGRLIATVALDYAPPPGSPSLRGQPCVRVMAAVARQRHAELVGDLATLVLTEMRVRGSHALAIVGLRTTGERVVELQRERGSWTIDSLFDSGVT
jgi:hypothetical protein